MRIDVCVCVCVVCLAGTCTRPRKRSLSSWQWTTASRQSRCATSGACARGAGRPWDTGPTRTSVDTWTPASVPPAAAKVRAPLILRALLTRRPGAGLQSAETPIHINTHTHAYNNTCTPIYVCILLFGVQSAEMACERCTVRCTVTKRRGRPPGIKETKPRKRASGVGSEDVKNQMQLVRMLKKWLWFFHTLHSP